MCNLYIIYHLFFPKSNKLNERKKIDLLRFMGAPPFLKRSFLHVLQLKYKHMRKIREYTKIPKEKGFESGSYQKTIKHLTGTSHVTNRAEMYIIMVNEYIIDKQPIFHIIKATFGPVPKKV